MTVRRYLSVFGAGGYIGQRVTSQLRTSASPVQAIRRHDSWRGRELGDVLYCIGLTADFRTRLRETVEAHVTLLSEVLSEGRWDSFTYMSSTRVYAGLPKTLAREDDRLSLLPSDPSDLYNLSKALGESLTLAEGARLGKRTHALRISNVVGPGMTSPSFLTSIVHDALIDGHITLRTSRESEKDYVHVDNVIEAALHVVRQGNHAVYNVGSGNNTAHGSIVDALVALTGCRVDVAQDAPLTVFPVIDITRIASEIPYRPALVLDYLPGLVREINRERSSA